MSYQPIRHGDSPAVRHGDSRAVRHGESPCNYYSENTSFYFCYTSYRGLEQRVERPSRPPCNYYSENESWASWAEKHHLRELRGHSRNFHKFPRISANPHIFTIRTIFGSVPPARAASAGTPAFDWSRYSRAGPVDQSDDASRREDNPRYASGNIVMY